MFKAKAAFNGFSVDDLAKARAFYAETLGLKVDNEGVGLRLHLPGGGTVFAYPKEDHQPATFTILNVVVASIDEAVDELTNRGVQFEHDEDGPKTDAAAGDDAVEAHGDQVGRSDQADPRGLSLPGTSTDVPQPGG
jgi:catechol 2,3-dioxygenase-like lactoylglutathione lyase family enzyme